MTIIKPIKALELLYRERRITHDQMDSLKNAPLPALSDAMLALETDEGFLTALAGAVEGIEAKQVEQNSLDQALREDSRYAQAPDVTGVFVRQVWEPGDYLHEVSRTQFTVPLHYLVENRARMEQFGDYEDNDWLVFDLGLNADHDGPFDVDEIKESVAAWLKATETTS